LTEAAAISTRTWPGPGSTTGTSMISMESGPPGVRITAARNVLVVVAPVPVVVPVVVDMFASHGRVTSRHPSVEPH
jgi:hypothetical protein